MSETLSTESSTPSVSEAWKVKFDILQKMGRVSNFCTKPWALLNTKGLVSEREIRFPSTS